MSLQVHWTARARGDLLDIYLAIAIENRSAAQAVFDRLRARVSVLPDHPRLGPRRDDIRLGLRVLVERPYLLVYRLTPDFDDQRVARIDIIRVVDGRRDLARLL